MMLDVTGDQRDAFDHLQLARTVADLLLDLAIRGDQGILAGLHDALGQAELVAVAAGTVFADQEDRLGVEHGDDHDRIRAAGHALEGTARAVGKLQIDLLNPEQAALGDDAPIQYFRFAKHERNSDGSSRCKATLEQRGDKGYGMIDWQRIDTVFLDMDGTLLDLHFDNHFWLEHVPERYAQARGLAPEVAKAQLLARYRDIEGTLEWYCVDHWSRELGLDIALLKQEVEHLIAVHPHVLDFLEALERRGKRRVLVTNAHQKALALKLIADAARRTLRADYLLA